jgi:hypothetical protein
MSGWDGVGDFGTLVNAKRQAEAAQPGGFFLLKK